MTLDQPTAATPPLEDVSFDPATGLVRAPFKRLIADPHGTFRKARALGPLIGFSDGTVMAVRAPDVMALLSDRRLRQVGVEGLESAGVTAGAFHDFAAETMLLSHGDDHVRRRAPLAKPFAFPVMKALRPVIRETAETLVAGWDGEVDLRDAFAAQLPARTIAAILGIPAADVPRFTRLVYGASQGLTFGVRAEEYAPIDAAVAELTAYARGLLESRRAAPHDDLLSEYVARVDGEGELSASEIVTQIVTVIIGGADTTRSAMTALVSLLMDHRDQWDAVVADPGFAAGAVAEGLRYEPSVGSVGVVATETLEVGGVPVAAGQVVTLSTMSAMRDGALYADPDRFDITRDDHPRLHLVFGGGPHRCLGEALARIELEEGLAALAAAWPGLRRVGPPVRMRGVGGIRTASSLRVAPGR